MSCSASSLLQTISALLDFSKLEAHAVKLSIAPLSLTDLLVDCQELLITLASEKELDLTYNVDPDVPIVEGDGARMRQSEWRPSCPQLHTMTRIFFFFVTSLAEPDR
jgi:signal transduction histidine kinase